jgi:tripartite-type tricarboxylate transporter receptor subunit TctC
VLLGVLAASTPLCRAQGAYPAKPVHLIVPSTAGGTTDIVGRALAQALSQQPVLEHVRAGTLRALAVTSAARSDLLCCPTCRRLRNPACQAFRRSFTMGCWRRPAPRATLSTG